MLPTLPIEVIEIVIDAATYHTQTLRNFALTCRDLLPRSRCHLIRYLCFRDIAQLLSFYKFLNLRPRVGCFVLSLKLSAIPDDPKSLSVLQIIPTLLFQKLPNLHIWQISDPETFNHKPRRWLTFPSPTLACLRAHGTAIVELRLDSVSLPNCAHFVEYIMAFRGLRFLYCNSVHFKTDIDGLRLSRVKQRLAGRLRLSTLIIGRDVPDDATLTLLESSPSTLLDLELHVREETEIDLPSVVSNMHALRSVTLALQLCEPDSEGGDVREKTVLRTFKIIEALSLHSESHLQTLIVHLREVNIPSLLQMVSKADSYPDLEHCRGLESVLLRFRSLHNLEVHHNVQRDIDWTFILEQYLPTLARQRSVTFKHLMPTYRRHSASHDKRIWTLGVSPDSKWIVSGSEDCTIILWDVQRRSIVHEWIAHSDTVSSVVFSPDGQRLASTGFDGLVVVWDISGSGAKRVATLVGHAADVNACTWSLDGTLLMSGADDGTVRIWDTRTYQQLQLLQEPSNERIWLVRFSPDGRWIVSGGDSNSFSVWDAITRDLRAVFRGHRGYLRNAMFDPTTGRIATASEDHTIRIWDIEKEEALLVLEGHTDRVQDASFSPDGRHVLSASEDRTVKVWDSFSGDLLLSLEGHTNYVYAACFSPDGKHIASASWDKTVRLWRASDGRCIRTFNEHTRDIECLAYSPDGETLTSGGWDMMVCIRHLCDVVPEEHSEADGVVQSK